VVVWGYLRHYINLKILYSILTTFKTIGPFELNWVTQQYKCWISQYISFGLLASLQAVNLFWFFLILRIAFRFIYYKTADDDRSEYEPSEEETEEREKELQTLKSEANATGIDAPGVPVQNLTT
jgi:acyl-CoA-dependent ceramide synthase